MSRNHLFARASSLGPPPDYFIGRSYSDLCLANNIILFSRTSRRELQRKTFESRPHHRCVLIFNLKTAGVVHVDRQRIPLEAGCGLLLLPFQFHAFPEVEAERLLWLILTFETEQQALLEDFRSKVFPCNGAARATLSSILDLYRGRPGETSSRLLALETAKLITILRPLVRRSMEPRMSGDGRARKLLGDVDRNLRASGRWPTIAQLAESLHISEGRLRSRFRSDYSLTLGSYLRNYRLHRVIDLMRDTRLNLADIAEETDFSDSAALSRFFRSQTGKPPRAFRREMAARSVARAD